MYHLDLKTNVPSSQAPSSQAPSQETTPRDESQKSDFEIIQRSFTDFMDYYDNYMANQGANYLGLNISFRTKASYNFLLNYHYQAANQIPHHLYWVSQQKLLIPENCPYNWQGLCKIVVAEDLDMIEELIQKGFRPHLYGFDIQFAVIFHLKTYLRYLLVRELGYQNKHFPVYLATVYGDNETLQILLDFGARATKQNSFAFALACYVGRYDQARILVLYGSSFWITDQYLFMFPELLPYRPTLDDMGYKHSRNIEASKFTRMLRHSFPKDWHYTSKEKFINMLYAFGSNLTNQLKNDLFARDNSV